MFSKWNLSFMLVVLVIFTGCTNTQSKTKNDTEEERLLKSRLFKKWPIGRSPAEIGRLVADDVILKLKGKITQRYYSALSLRGVLMFSEVIDDTKMCDDAIAVYEPFLRGEKKIKGGHGDLNVFGVLPFEIFHQTGKSEYLSIPLRLAEEQFTHPREDGLSRQVRFWIDDTYMMGVLQMQAYRSTNDIKYLERAVAQLLAYIEKLQQSNGLSHHSLNAPFFWGRGNGWLAAALTEALLTVPEEHPKRELLMKAYQKLMSALIQYQGKSGMWHNLIDHQESFQETSCTGMFVFAMATGLDKGWLPTSLYGKATKRAWLALAERVDDKGRPKDVCPGTNEGFTVEYYLARKPNYGHLHGHMSLLWAATAMIHCEN